MHSTFGIVIATAGPRDERIRIRGRWYRPVWTRTPKAPGGRYMRGMMGIHTLRESAPLFANKPLMTRHIRPEEHMLGRVLRDRRPVGIIKRPRWDPENEWLQAEVVALDIEYIERAIRLGWGLSMYYTQALGRWARRDGAVGDPPAYVPDTLLIPEVPTHHNDFVMVDEKLITVASVDIVHRGGVDGFFLSQACN